VTSGGGPTPPLRRRLLSLVYELLLLFGLALLPGALGALFVAQTAHGHWAQSDAALRAYALFFYAIYFVWFWSRRGQTLAMQTWRIAVQRADGARLTEFRAVGRFAAACVAWFAAPLAIASALALRPWPTLALVAGWAVVYGLSSRFAPDRQFWHDRVAGTRLVDLREPKTRAGG
jgi:uncharacterized RDD family membrane protein YckC